MTPTLHSQTLWKIILSVYLQWTKLSYHMHLIVHMHIIWVQNNWLSCKKVLQWKYLAKWVSVTLSLHAESNHGPLHYEWNANPNLSGLVFLWNEQGFVITCTWLYTSYAHHEGPKQLMELQKGLTEGTCSKMYICQPTRGIEPRTFSLQIITNEMLCHWAIWAFLQIPFCYLHKPYLQYIHKQATANLTQCQCKAAHIVKRTPLSMTYKHGTKWDEVKIDHG